MNPDGGPLGTPGKLELKFPSSTSAKGVRISHRQSGGSNPPRFLLSALAQKQVSDFENGMAASEAEVAKTFAFAPSRPAPRGSTNDENQQGPSARTPQSVDPPRNGPVALVSRGIPARRSQQFLPEASKTSVPRQETHLLAPTNSALQVPSSHAPHSKVYQGNFSPLVQPHVTLANPQSSRQLQGLQSHAASQALPPTIDARPHSRQVSPTHQIVSQIVYAEENLEGRYETGVPLPSNDRTGEAETGEFGDYYANQEPNTYERNSEYAEQGFDAIIEQELYPEQNQQDDKDAESAPSQGPPAGPSPEPAFSIGFTQQFEEYMKTHEQDARDAEERWKNSTLEEWKEGKGEMLEHVRKIVDMTKIHMKRKLTAYRTLHDDLDGHGEGLQKRRKLLGELEKDATQTGKGLMARLIGRGLQPTDILRRETA